MGFGIIGTTGGKFGSGVDISKGHKSIPVPERCATPST